MTETLKAMLARSTAVDPIEVASVCNTSLTVRYSRNQDIIEQARLKFKEDWKVIDKKPFQTSGGIKGDIYSLAMPGILPQVVDWFVRYTEFYFLWDGKLYVIADTHQVRLMSQRLHGTSIF